MKSFLLITQIVVFFSTFNSTLEQNADKADSVLNDSIQIVEKRFKTDAIKIECEMLILKGTKLCHGIQKIFYSDGNLYSKIPYTMNIRTGIAYTYYKSYGNTRPQGWKEQPNSGGKLNGLCKRYHENG